MEGETSKTYFFGNGEGSTIPAWAALMNNNNGLFGGNSGWGGGILGFLLGLFFGNGWGGFGNGFGGFGGGNGAGFLSNQINNDSGRELLMNAINSNGEASRAAVQNLATMLGQDFNLVNSAVQTLQSSLSTLALQQAVSVPQIINSIQNGDASLSRQLCECCCENRLLTTQQGYESRIQNMQQTEALSGAITGSGQRTVDAIADLKTTMIDQFCQAEKRDMQSEINRQGEIITQLRGQIDNDRQTSQLYGVIAPLQAKINEIANKQPNTVPVQWPQITAVNTTPNMGGYFGFSGGFNPYGYGWGGQSYWG